MDYFFTQHFMFKKKEIKIKKNKVKLNFKKFNYLNV